MSLINLILVLLVLYGIFITSLMLFLVILLDLEAIDLALIDFLDELIQFSFNDFA